MYSEYCRLRDEVTGYVEVRDYGEEGDSWSKYDYTEPKHSGKMFNIYWDEIDDDNTKFYATHAFKYCLDHNTLWFDEYVIRGDEDVMDDFMRFYRYGMNVLFVDEDDLEFSIDEYIMYDIDENNLYDIPIHAKYLEYGSGITYFNSADEAIDLIEDNIDNKDKIKRILDIYNNGTKLEDRKYKVDELLEIGYSHEQLLNYMKHTNEYHRIYASKNLYMDVTLSYLLNGYPHRYYQPHEPWNGTLREYYLSCPYIKEKKGSRLKSECYRYSYPKPIWTKH